MPKIQNLRPTRKPRVLIITPALAAANNGNWRTAARWRSFLSPIAHIEYASQYVDQACDMMIALHARRSADSIAAFAGRTKPCLVVLTGTDLYRDIDTDESAKRSLALADRLVVLQSLGLKRLTEAQQAKCTVIEQSAPSLRRLAPRRRSFDLALVGHLRDEKDPLTAARALRHLKAPEIRLRHVGRADDPKLGPAMRQAASTDSRIELLGELEHAESRRLIRSSRALVLPSIMEGGAHVLIEAVTSNTPVLASKIDGSVGLLGDTYAGYFPSGDDQALADLIRKSMREPDFLAKLQAQGAARAHLFTPEREASLLRSLVSEMLAS